MIADTLRAFRVLETSHPPVYYLPPADVLMERLRPAAGASHCEWKGRAAYYDLVAGSRRANRAAWCYPSPSNAFAALSDHVAFYLPALDRGLVDGVEACAQPGGFYGGWITPELVGPFKGEPGTEGW